MALLRAQGKLTYLDPSCDGCTDLLRYAHVWRPDKRWTGQGVEFIEPLGAIAPVGNLASAHCAWTADPAHNLKLRQVIQPGSPPVSCIEFFDASAYAAGTPQTTSSALVTSDDLLDPNLVLRMYRYSAPPNQGIIPNTKLALAASLKVTAGTGSTYFLDEVAGTWTDGYVYLYVPFVAAGNAKASLWAEVEISAGVYSDAIFLSDHDSADAAKAGGTTDVWTVEYVEDEALASDGHHILIRNLTSSGDYWYVNHPCVKLVQGIAGLLMGGCRQQVTCYPITYSNADHSDVCEAWPVDAQPLASAAWNPTPTWGELDTPADDWTITVDEYSAVQTGLLGVHRPKVTFTPAAAYLETRPVVWFATEDHPRTIKAGSIVASQTTEGNEDLYGWELNIGDYGKTWAGSASFKPSHTELYPAWLEGGKLVVNGGWQADAGTGLAAADVATCYITPGGIKRWITAGDQAAEGAQKAAYQLSVEFADFLTARAGADFNAIVDFMQAGGFTAGIWFAAAGLAMGLPESLLHVDATIADQLLPVGRPPSRENLQPQDGEGWRAHLDAVCQAAKLHWYWAFDGLHLDAGAIAAYTPGVSPIAFTLDYDTATEEDILSHIEVTRNAGPHATALKATYGQAGREKAYYYLAAALERETDGGEKWAYLDLVEGDDVTAALAAWSKDHRVTSELAWEGPLRRTLLPQLFVQITDLPINGVLTNAVYQIVEHRMACNVPADATSNIVLRHVYTPASIVLSTQADWQAGTQTDIDTTSVPGSVLLAVDE